MTEYAVSTNLISWVPAKVGIFGWPQDGPEAETVDGMRPGDLLIPKFSQRPDYRRVGSQADYVKGICDVLGRDYDEELADYEARVNSGAGAVPFIWEVRRKLADNDSFPSDEPWSCVEITQVELPYPLSTSEFLKLRAIPIELARQFKATAAPGRHIQAVAPGTADRILGWGQEPERGPEALRRLSLVKAATPLEAVDLLDVNERGPDPGDYVFLFGVQSMPGFHIVEGGWQMRREGEEISLSPLDLGELLEQAKDRATPGDDFRPGNAVAAAAELLDFINSPNGVRDVAEFGTFYDRYVNLPNKVSQALELAARDTPPRPLIDDDDMETEEGEGEDGEQVELDNLHGLTTAAAQAQLPEIVLPPSVLAEAVTALRSGKHLLLSGPPGTGKSTVAAALCRAVMAEQFDLATATADWTTFDTIGGYMPRGGGALEFEPGLVLRSLQRGHWLVIDELNRADIDKSFGPLFTLLSGAGEAGGGESVVLPFRKGDKNIRVVWSERREGAGSPYALTPGWRLIGTLNVRDKATLFQLSFAFLRRFAIIDVPLPGPEEYRALYERWSQGLESELLGTVTEAAMQVAFGPRRLGPAILKDIAAFTGMGLTATETASVSSPYEDPLDAFLTAVRLYAVPQYEGATQAEADELMLRLRGALPDAPAEPLGALEQALADVRL